MALPTAQSCEYPPSARTPLLPTFMRGSLEVADLDDEEEEEEEEEERGIRRRRQHDDDDDPAVAAHRRTTSADTVKT